METGKPDHYIAYCFRRSPWKVSVAIVACTDFVDANFFKYGVYRGRWTLRVSPKETGRPRLVKVLHSPMLETATISELKSWVKGRKHALRKNNSPFSVHGPTLDTIPSARMVSLDLPIQNMKHSLKLL